MPRAKRTVIDAKGRAMPLTRRGFGYLRQLPSSRWQASYIGPDHKRHRAPQTFAKKVAAEMWLTKVFEDIQNEKWAPKAKEDTFGPYAERWLKTRRGRDGRELAPRTKANYEDYLENLKTTDLYDAALSDVTAPMLRKVHAAITETSGATTAARHASFIRGVLNTAEKDGLIARNPTPSELCSTSTGQAHRTPTEAELTVLLDAIPERLKLAVALAAFGGLRLSEWRALRRCDLAAIDDGKRYVMTIARQAHRNDGEWIITETKGKEARQVALPEWLTPEITAHLETIPDQPSALLFPAKRADFISSEWTRAWTDARKKAGIVGEVRGHDLRHYYGTTLAKAGVSAPLLQAALGHKNISMSMKYVHLAKGASTDVADLIQKPQAAK